MGFGLSPIRNNRELRALIEFCRSELKEPYMALNPVRKSIFSTTIKLYEADLDELPIKVKINGTKHSYINIHEIIRDYTGYYWS